MSHLRLFAGAPALALLLACGDAGPVAPNLDRAEVAGTYQMTVLAFDPQGSLPDVDVLARLRGAGKPDPSLTLTVDGQLQLLFEDTGSTLLRLVQGSYRTTPDGVVLDLGSNTIYRSLLLPDEIRMTRGADGALVLDGDVSGVERDRLVALVPEWSSEPLAATVPGRLRLTFGPGA